MEKPLGVPKKGAVARLRELYHQRREQPLSQEEKKRLREVFKKKKPAAVEKPKKSAQSRRDLELP